MGRKSRLKRERKAEEAQGNAPSRGPVGRSTPPISLEDALNFVTGGPDLEPFTPVLERELVEQRGWRSSDIAELRARGAMYHRQRNSAVLPPEIEGFDDRDDLEELEQLEELAAFDDPDADFGEAEVGARLAAILAPPAPGAGLTFEQAVARVRATRQEAAAAWTFIPRTRRGEAIGGELYIVTYEPANATEPDEYRDVYVQYVGGDFNAIDGEEGGFELDEVPAEARRLTYRPTTHYQAGLTGYVIEVVLQVLSGMPLDQARNDAG